MGFKIKKKYAEGGKVGNPPKDRSKEIAELKADIKENGFTDEKRALLKALNEETKKYNAGQFMDGLREDRAKDAESVGDEGRAQRIRSTKQTQGMGETGRDASGSRKSYNEARSGEKKKKFSKGGYIKYRKGGKMKDC
jgi:hypothetical protein